jgi:3-oxoadipate enol-lactonase
MQITVNGIQVHYELSGREGASIVVLSHSLGSSLVMWDPQMDVLRSRFQVLRYDTRGHGGTGAPQGAYTLDGLVKDAVGLLDALGISKVHWVGLSMGGMIGQGVVLSNPERLLSLALCDTAAALPGDVQPVWEERIGRARSRGMGSLVEETLGRWFTAPYLQKNPPEVQKIREQFLGTPVAGYIGCSEAIRRLDYLPHLHRVTLPALIVVGEDDPGTPVASSKAMHERIAGSQLVVLPHAAHLSNIEQNGPFNEALLDFLMRADQAPAR